MLDITTGEHRATEPSKSPYPVLAAEQMAVYREITCDQAVLTDAATAPADVWIVSSLAVSFAVDWRFVKPAPEVIVVVPLSSMNAAKMSTALETAKSIPTDSLISFAKTEFSDTSHFNLAVSDEDYTIVPLGPRIDGQYRLPTA